MKILWGATVAAAALAVSACDNRKAADETATDQTADATATMPSDSGMAPPTDPMATTQTTAGAAAMDVPAYVQTAASGDMFEIRSSELARKQSKTSQVRDFAQRMITDHQASTAALKKAVQEGAAGTTVPAEIMPRHQQMLRELEQADAAAFDRLYIEQQRTAHAEALDLHRSFAGRADVPPQLKAFAQQTAQTVEGHHERLMQMPTATAGAQGAATPTPGQ